MADLLKYFHFWFELQKSMSTNSFPTYFEVDLASNLVLKHIKNEAN